VFNGVPILKLITRHDKSARIGTKNFKYAELRNASEFSSMAAINTSRYCTSLLYYLKKHVVGQAVKQTAHHPNCSKPSGSK
jgi:hypothetical protein